ncbi:4-hydroxy 2-oxovalerate aldolase [Micromonospora matsumotoense]|uniref:4-hydroxy 2-oxovalerate aldolase n=1 Tax=Micromonospora matsumotoense TaxID=121616 RepID=A0A1C4Z675_9ACTN|nr:pyruvate carboxyltransferase [Micromonospora matsumotoense]SCF28488.1 4-hydroxy 2-oxovalerate aldolase [Micromonospora matsumotoense]
MNPNSKPDLLDVTLRDGGYVNGHSWATHEAQAIVRAIGGSGVPYVEVGYLRDTAVPRRPSASCPPDYLDALAALTDRPRLAVMVRPGEVSVSRVADLPGHDVSMARVLVSGGSVAKAEPYVAAARAAGLTVAMNLTRVSERTETEIAQATRACADVGAQLVYLADSNGSLDPETVTAQVGAAVAATTTPIGFHPHDNLGLAFINAKAAITAGATAIDASIAGIGKGGGNLRMEVIVAHLIVRHGAGLRLDPIAADQTTLAAQLRMLAEGNTKAVLTGLLDLNLDGAAEFYDMVAANGYDATILTMSGR